MKYLKDQIYYSDLYDRITVEECRRAEQSVKDTKIEEKDLTPEERTDALRWVNHLYIYTLSGERYEKKSETIQRWMARDRAIDEKLEKATPPTGITCLKCGSNMHLESKDLFGDERILFMFRCDSECKQGKAFYDNGQEYIPKPNLCPKCNGFMESKYQKKSKAITTTFTCTKCGHSYTDTINFDDKKEKPDPNYLADRNRFCLDEKAGSEYMDFKIHMSRFKELVTEIEDRDKNKEVYEAVAKIKKLTVGEVQKLLIEATAENNYSSLQFEQPQMGKDLIVPFTAIDSKPDRSEYNSKQDIRKLIEKTLVGANWKLMSDGINYRVGYVSGRLRCLEKEADLIDLVK